MADWSKTDAPATGIRPSFTTNTVLAIWVVLCLVAGSVAGTVAGNLIHANTQAPPPALEETHSPGASVSLPRPLDTCPEAETQVEDEYRRPEILSHTVQQGETLWEIAKRYGTDVGSLTSINGLASGHHISPGQKLTVITTPGLVYRVRSGDTLWDISQAYGVSAEEVSKANDLEVGILSIGQTLILPGARAAVLPTARVASVPSQSVDGFTWPLNGQVTSGFGMRWGRMHEGVDIASPYGTHVVAAREGEVVFAGWNGGGYGNAVLLDHSQGITSLYAHLSKITVAKGERVLQGQVLGGVGSTGFAFGPHLHFEIRIDGVPQDPLLSLP